MLKRANHSLEIKFKIESINKKIKDTKKNQMEILEPKVTKIKHSLDKLNSGMKMT